MRLLKVELKNFVSHEDTEISFAERGVTVIVGPNGAGKSSIFKGILFGLFGEGQPKALRRAGSSGGFGVRLEFKRGNDLYFLSRQYALKRGALSPDEREVYLLKNNLIVAGSRVKDLNAAVRRELGGGKEVFTLSAMALQGQIGGLFDQEPLSRRRELLEKVLGFHIAKLVAEAARLLKSRYSDSLKGGLNAIRVSSIKEAEDSLKEIQEQEREARERAESLEKELAKVSRLLKEAEERLAKAQERERRRDRLKTQLESLERNLRSLREEIKSDEEKIKSLPELRENLRALSEELEALGPLREELLILEKIEGLRKEEKRFEELLKEAARAAEAVKALEGVERRKAELEERLRKVQEESQRLARELGKLESLESELAKLRREWAEAKRALEKAEARLPEGLLTQEQVREAGTQLQERLAEVRGTLGEVKGREKELLSSKEGLSGARGKCPLCGQELTPEHLREILRETEEELARLKERKAQLLEEAKNLKTRLENLTEAARFAEEADKKRAKLQDLEARGKELAQALRGKEALAEQVKKFKKEEQELREELKALEQKLQELAAKRERLAQIKAEKPEEELKKVREQRRELEDKRAFPELSKEEIQNKIARLEALKAKEAQLRDRVAALSALAQGLEEKRKKLARLEEERRGVEEEIRELGPPADLGALEREVEKLRHQRESLSAQLAAHKEKVEHLKKEVAEASARLEGLRRLQWKLRVAGDLAEALRGDWLEKRFGEAFEDLDRRFGEAFARFGFDGEAHIDLGNVQPYIKRGTFLVSSLSGGERVAAGLALRLAIASKFGLECFFLDEPTTYMDDERVHGLVELIDALRSSPRAPQIVIITHDDQLFHPIADRVVRVRKRGGVSVVEADV